MSRFVLRALPFLWLLLAAAQAGAQTWPSRPVRFVVPFPPGGSTDVAARTLADRLGRAMGAHDPVTTLNLVVKNLSYDTLRDFGVRPAATMMRQGR